MENLCANCQKPTGASNGWGMPCCGDDMCIDGCNFMKMANNLENQSSVSVLRFEDPFYLWSVCD